MTLNKITSRFERLISYIERRPWIVFLFFAILVFIFFQSLFKSYFESDEWPLFTFYLPLTRHPFGFLTALISTIFDNGALSGGQHVIPVASEIYFLNVYFFGLHFAPYAFMSLFVHLINSFLLYILVKNYFANKDHFVGFIFAIISGVFFALSSVPMHAPTGAAPFYSQNVLTVTFFLLCILSFRKAFKTVQKKYIYLTVVFLFLALFTKETSACLFILLPLMALMGKRVFPIKDLAKIFIICVIFYGIVRFIIPHAIHKFEHNVVNNQATVTQTVPDNSIVSKDLSIYKNLPAEILFRTVTFPIRMMSELYFPRPTISVLVGEITPFVYPVLNITGEPDHSQKMLVFTTGPGNDYLIFIFSIIIFILLYYLIKQLKKNKDYEKLQLIIMGISIIILSTLPLVMIVFAFPRWGVDTYFDSRHYYLSNVGGAILFPFLLYIMAYLLSKSLRQIFRFFIPTFIFASLLFLVWFINNMVVFNNTLKGIVNDTGIPRRLVVDQMKKELPVLPQKVVFYVETDGLGSYGKILPFQTSVPQAISIVYFDKSPLPDSFYNTTLFNAQPEGYQYADGRGFGYYISKQSLADALLVKKFSINDIYAFYYNSRNNNLSDTTRAVRSEMKKYLTERKTLVNWKAYNDATSAAKLSFSYPPDVNLIENPVSSADSTTLKDFNLDNLPMKTSIRIISVDHTFDSNTFITALRLINHDTKVTTKRISFDTYHENDANVVTNGDTKQYFMKFNNVLVLGTINENNADAISEFEKILGSVTIIQ